MTVLVEIGTVLSDAAPSSMAASTESPVVTPASARGCTAAQHILQQSKVLQRRVDEGSLIEVQGQFDNRFVQRQVVVGDHVGRQRGNGFGQGTVKHLIRRARNVQATEFDFGDALLRPGRFASLGPAAAGFGALAVGILTRTALTLASLALATFSLATFALATLALAAFAAAIFVATIFVTTVFVTTVFMPTILLRQCGRSERKDGHEPTKGQSKNPCCKKEAR